MEDLKVIQDRYNSCVEDEWDRLKNHFFEFEITKRFIDKYIKSGDKVIDIGGGPGRYSLHLAKKGCDVALFDLSDGNIKFAKNMAKSEGITLKTIAGDAREVDKLTTTKYDHVLLMGPLYHLLDEESRVNAVNASLNILKPGGTIFISFISSYGGIIYSMKYEPELICDETCQRHYKLFEDDQPFCGESFTNCYFARHKDVLPFMSQFDLEKLHYFGQEGILAPCEEVIKASSEKIQNKWIDLSEKVCEREDLLSFSEHLMYVGRKKH